MTSLAIELYGGYGYTKDFPVEKYWRDAKIVTAGIDVGSVSSQAVVCVDGELYGFNSMRTGNNSPDSATNALAGVLEKSGMNL